MVNNYNTALSDSLADMVDWSHLNYMPINLKNVSGYSPREA